jgi:hypothetical protein
MNPNRVEALQGKKYELNFFKLEQGPGTITFMMASFVHYSFSKTFSFFSVECVSAAEGRFCAFHPLLSLVN